MPKIRRNQLQRASDLFKEENHRNNNADDHYVMAKQDLACKGIMTTLPLALTHPLKGQLIVLKWH